VSSISAHGSPDEAASSLASRTRRFYAQVAVDADAGTIFWPNGVDLDPDMLYDAAHGAADSHAPA
jgi:hypothetical protein